MKELSFEEVRKNIPEEGQLPHGYSKKEEPLKQHEESNILQLKYPDVPCGMPKLEEPILSEEDMNDWDKLMKGEHYESREFELERENERLLIVVDMQKLEIENLRKQLYSAPPGLQSLPNNY